VAPGAGKVLNDVRQRLPGERRALILAGQAIENLVLGADLLQQLLASYPDRRDLARQLLICEQHGKQLTRDLVHLLHRQPTMLIEPGELYELALAVDAIVDDLEQTADYMDLYRLERAPEESARLAASALDAARLLTHAWDQARDLRSPEFYLNGIRRLRAEGERLARATIADLTRSETDPLVALAWRDVYRGLGRILHAEERAGVLMDRIVARNA
jgi:uncharacterized protein